MKNLSLPYLKSFLLLTVFVGLIVNAKFLLLNKFATGEDKVVAISQKLPAKSVKDSIVKTATKPIKSPLIKSAREQSARDMLEAFAAISDESEVNPIQIASLNSKPKPIENSAQIISEGVSKPISKSSVISLTETTPIDSKEPSTESLITSSADIIKKLETKLTAPVVIPPKREITSYNRRSNFFSRNDLAIQAELRLHSKVTYDGRYLRMGYPMGDVPSNIGVCTDVVIRSLRGLGVDLQQRVHEDMKRNFRRYPNKWQLKRPDSNIDHRRVPNLMTYFKRAGAALRISSNPADYKAGNIVAWEMGNGMTHIGIVSTSLSAKTGNPLIVHNIGVGPELTDILFDFKIIGHYNYSGNKARDRGFPSLKMAEAVLDDLNINAEDVVYN